jgi:signal transduction histidine kinase
MTEAHGRGLFIVTTELLNGNLRISFADDGPGIPPEIVNRIFDPFFTTKEIGKGTGLGLSISHSIITKFGGRIWAESQYGKGATFIIEFPLKNDNLSGEAPALQPNGES